MASHLRIRGFDILDGRAASPRVVDPLRNPPATTVYRSASALRLVLRPASLALVALLVAAPIDAGLQEGLDALRKRDYATAAKELKPLAERGDAEAQYRIGLMYEHGAGYPKDMKQGVAWLTKAATQGHASAQQELGVIYSTGDGVPRDPKRAAGWFAKAAAQDNMAAQFNLGLLYAKGDGVPNDLAQALALFRRAAAQGFAPALEKVGIAYEEGIGGTKDAALAYLYYAIAARGGAPDHAARRDAIGATLPAAQVQSARAMADAWRPGQPLPTTVAAAGPGTGGAKAAAVKTRCAASGTMAGERFRLAHCAVSLMQDQRSVAIWFNEAPIDAAEADDFALSSYAKDSKAGKPRTLVQVMFCPSGGAIAPASPAALKKIDFNSAHARAPLAGLQDLLEAPKDFQVEKMSGTVEPGGVLSGKIVGKHGNSAWTLDFEVVLPAKDAAAGLSCK